MAVRYDEVLEQGFYTILLLTTWTSAAGDHTRQEKTTRKDTKLEASRRNHTQNTCKQTTTKTTTRVNKIKHTNGKQILTQAIVPKHRSD